MLLYLISKKTQDIGALWQKIKTKYENTSLVASLEDYISASGKKNREERILVATLLMESLGHMKCFNHECREPLTFEKYDIGKPYFTGTNLRVNVAHNEKFVVIAYAKYGEIGVDIESEIDEEKAEKLSKRFPNIGLLKAEQKGDGSIGKILAFEMSAEDVFTPISLASADCSFTAKWTAAEAIMKCDGGGFSALPELQKLGDDMNTFSFTFDAEEKKQCVSISISER